MGAETLAGIAIVVWISMQTLISIFVCLAAAMQTSAPATRASDRATIIVVVGAEGTPEYGKDFNTWADRWAAVAKKGDDQFVQIGRDDATSDREKLQKVLADQPRDGTSPLWIVLIGHGTFDGREAKLNLRGPDVTDVEFGEWIKPFTRPLAVIDCTSSSAPFLNRVSGKNRTVITATRSGSEVNFSRFGDYFSAAISDPAADLDKDGQTSLLEAFLAASHRVEEFYKQNSRLSTEHALLDDNGDGLGVSADWFDGLRATRGARNGSPVDGPRAHQWYLLLSPSEQSMSPENRTKRDAIELQIADLRDRKSKMSETDYYSQLETLLLQLARIYQGEPAGGS